MPTLNVTSYRSDWTRPIVLLSAVGALLLLACPTASAQPAAGAAAPAKTYLEFPVDHALSRMPQEVGLAMRAGTFAPGQQEKFDKYYKRYVLSRWSEVDNVPLLPRSRKSLRLELSRAAGPNVHAHLVGLILKAMRLMATQQPTPDDPSLLSCHPAVRYNAMLMIGYLNVTEAPRPGQAPVPDPEALQELLKAINPGPNGPQLPEAVRAAALIGLIRHARIGIPAAQQPAVEQAAMAMIRLATTADPADQGKVWMRGQGAEVLGLLGIADQNGTVANALSAMVADTRLPFSTRCKAAEAIGRLKYAAGGQINAEALAVMLGQLVLDACNAEKAAEADDAIVSRRRLLHCVTAALTGVDALAAASASQGKVTEIQATLTTIRDAAGVRSLPNDQLLTAIQAGRDKLAELLQ